VIKALFVVGQCIRALHSDPWQSQSYVIREVGHYSYLVGYVGKYFYGQDESIAFEDQKDYAKVHCPKEEK
jgi:hypothetical protein